MTSKAEFFSRVRLNFCLHVRKSDFRTGGFRLCLTVLYIRDEVVSGIWKTKQLETDSVRNNLIVRQIKYYLHSKIKVPFLNSNLWECFLTFYVGLPNLLKNMQDN